jgi:hypothetical protein
MLVAVNRHSLMIFLCEARDRFRVPRESGTIACALLVWRSNLYSRVLINDEDHQLDEIRSRSSLICAMKHPEKPHFLRHCSALLVLAVIVGASPIRAGAQTATFNIPPVKIPLDIKDQEVSIAVSALVFLVSKGPDLNVLKVELTADLSDLQQNMTSLLSSQLDKDDRCGDHIAIQHATLTPVDPASLAVVQLHYERWVCAKLLGKQQSQKVVSGNAVIQMKLTPAIDEVI